jgi:limonene-1,2-epoxide hydrolase
MAVSDQEGLAVIGYADTPKAWWLTRGMARISGVNLQRAVLEGWLQRRELESLVSRCAACNRSELCETWLSRSGNARSMPDFCPNKTEIEALIS